MTTGFLISAEKCPKCKKEALFPFSRMVKGEKEPDKFYGILGMKCHECGWTTDEKEDLEQFRKWVSENPLKPIKEAKT